MAQIKGKKVDALRTFGDLYVSVELNTTDPEAVKANAGKAAPRLVCDIEGQTFRNAVVVDNGSVIQFVIRSRGQYGFGYRIDAGVLVKNGGEPVLDDKRRMRRDSIARRLYCFDKDGDGKALKDIDRGFQSRDGESGDTPLIQVKNFRSVGIDPNATLLQAAAMSCTVFSWNVYGYIDNEDDADYGMPLNIGETAYGPTAPVQPPDGPLAPSLNAQGVELEAFGGAPMRYLRSGASTPQFGSGRLIREDDPNQAPNYTSFAMLVAG